MERDRLRKDQFDPEEVPYQVPPGEDGHRGSDRPDESGALRPDEIDPDAIDPQRLVRETRAEGDLENSDAPVLPEEVPAGLVELVRYPSREEADMLMPWLEDAEINARIESIEGPVVEGLTATYPPRGTYRVMVPLRDIDEAQRLCEDFETQREHMRSLRTPEEEPQRIEQPDDP